MTQIPPPTQQAISSLLEAIRFCKQGQPEKAAKELTSSAKVAEVLPTMITDVYHFAHAAISLGIEGHIAHAGLLRLIDVVKTEHIQLSGPTWVGNLYRDTKTEASNAEAPDTHVEEGERNPFSSSVDLDHFTRDQLLRMGASHLSDGKRAYERRDLERALTSFREAYRIAKHLEYPQGVATCLFEIGFVIHSGGNSPFAEQHYRDALEIASVLAPSTVASIARYVVQVGRFFELERSSIKEREYLQMALRMFDQAGDAEGIRFCREKLGSGKT